MNNGSDSLFLWTASMLLSLLLCPLYVGIVNKVKAFFAGRRGPSVFQLYYDMRKLLCKGSVYSSTATDVLRLAPLASLAALFGCVLFLPFGMVHSPFAFAGDILLFIYLFGIGRAAMILGALDTGSSFEGMGASREAQFSALAEGVFLAAAGFLIVLTGDFTLSGVLTGFDAGAWRHSGTSMLLAALAFFLLMLCENCRVPFDDPETHLELTMIHEAMILDYGGPDLALIFYGSALKFWLFASFFVMMAFPAGLFSAETNVLLYFCGIFLSAIAVGTLESVVARYRFLKVPHLLSGALCLLVLAIVLMLFFKGVAQ